MRAGHEVALQHRSEYALISGRNLSGDVAAHPSLLAVILVAVGMATVDHDARGEPGFLQVRGCLIYGISIVVDRASTATQNHMTLRITLGDKYCCLSMFRVT